MFSVMTLEQSQERMHRALDASFKKQECPKCQRFVWVGFEAHIREICHFVCERCEHKWPVDLSKK